jgi:hypothetical protein
MAEWRPGPTGNRVQDEANRKAFDYLYELRGQNKATGTTAQPASGGVTVTVNIATGFTVGGNNNVYHNMTFKNGSLVGVS